MADRDYFIAYHISRTIGLCKLKWLYYIVLAVIANVANIATLTGHNIVVPMSVASYLELLDWTARELRSDKRSTTPASAAPIFERLGIDANTWCELTRDFGKLFNTVAGRSRQAKNDRIHKKPTASSAVQHS